MRFPKQPRKAIVCIPCEPRVDVCCGCCAPDSVLICFYSEMRYFYVSGHSPRTRLIVFSHVFKQESVFLSKTGWSRLRDFLATFLWKRGRAISEKEQESVKSESRAFLFSTPRSPKLFQTVRRRELRSRTLFDLSFTSPFQPTRAAFQDPLLPLQVQGQGW